MAAGNGTPDREQATRRQFFRVFGRQTAHSAGGVLAGVEALRRSSRDALDDLLSDEEQPRRGAQAIEAPEPPAVPPTAFRSPYRFRGQAIELLDQRDLPEHRPAAQQPAPDRACHLARGCAGDQLGALGQVAAYALAMVAQQVADRPAPAMAVALRGAADTLAVARPTSRALAVALDRVIAHAETVVAADEGPAAAASILAEADRIASADAIDLSRLGQAGADALRAPRDAAAGEGRPLAVLMHADQGPLTGGQVGAGTALLQGLAAAGIPVHAWLTEATPLYEGRRAAWQLGHLAIPHTLVPDTALGWLLEARRIDLLLLRAEWLLASGDVVAPLGSRVAARQAREAGVVVAVCATASIYDRAAVDAAAVPLAGRLPAPQAGHGSRIDPAADIVPAGLVDLLLTDRGALAPPFAEQLARVGDHS